MHSEANYDSLTGRSPVCERTQLSSLLLSRVKTSDSRVYLTNAPFFRKGSLTYLLEVDKPAYSCSILPT